VRLNQSESSDYIVDAFLYKVFSVSHSDLLYKTLLSQFLSNQNYWPYLGRRDVGRATQPKCFSNQWFCSKRL